MGPFFVTFVLLAVTSLGTASSPGCEELLKPFVVENPQVVFGKWIYMMGAGDPISYHKALDSLKSSWIDVTLTSDSQTVTLRWGDRCFGRCIYGEVNATVSGLSTTFRKNLSDHKGHLLQTCSDCLLWTDTFRNVDFTGRNLLLFTRSGKVDPKDVEIFKKQLQCLNFPQNFHSYDGKIELCPDDNENTE
ncbi:hypothetical protein WMY93_004450 [Mugilogobius chulae]|uniref:Apolipoprotein M n=1 Tax=Mugilogobius chulae TaxID=88201 RepID=A0AAW0PR57_9GOBI